MKRPWKRRYFCECQLLECEMCSPNGPYKGKTISIDDIYDLIKNPEPMEIGVDKVYNYES